MDRDLPAVTDEGGCVVKVGGTEVGANVYRKDRVDAVVQGFGNVLGGC